MEKEINYSPLYRTSSFEDAFILNYAGAILYSVEWDYRGELATFVFEEEKICLLILDKHKRKDLWVLSRDVITAYRDLKNNLFKHR